MWNTKYVDLVANREHEHQITTPGANIIYMVNNSAFTVYLDLQRAAADHFEEMAPGQGKALIIRKDPIPFVRFFSTGNAKLVVHEVVEDALKFLVLLQNVGQVTVFSTVGLKASELNLDGSKNLGVNVVTLPALPAGTNNIGDVDVLSLPPLPAGTNNIGDVDVLSLPAIVPAGWTWMKVVAAGAGDQLVKGTPGKIAKIAVEGAITVYPKDGANQCWSAGSSDFGNSPVDCLVDIKLNFSTAGTAWILFK